MKKEINQIEEILKLQLPLSFQKLSSGNKKTSLMVIGQVGSGKSTTLNYLNYIHCKQNELQFDKSQAFLSKKSASSVTKKVETQTIQNLQLIDTPGTNDPDKSLSNSQIQRQITDYITQAYQNQGISSIVNCLMMNSSQRIGQRDMDSLISLIISLNYLNLSYDENGPQLTIILTNFSKNSPGNSNKSNFPQSDSDSEEEQQEEDATQKFETIIGTIKDVLIQRLSQIYQGQYSQYQISQRVQKLLPQENFYCFKLVDFQQQDSENKELERLLTNATKYKNRVLSSFNQGIITKVDLDLILSNKTTFLEEINQLSDELQTRYNQFNNTVNRLKVKDNRRVENIISQYYLLQIGYVLTKLFKFNKLQDVRVLDLQYLDSFRKGVNYIQQALQTGEKSIQQEDLSLYQQQEQEKLRQKRLAEERRQKEIEEQRIQLEKERKRKEEEQRREMERLQREQEERERREREQERERERLEEERRRNQRNRSNRLYSDEYDDYERNMRILMMQQQLIQELSQPRVVYMNPNYGFFGGGPYGPF